MVEPSVPNSSDKKNAVEEFDYYATPSNFVDRFNSITIREHAARKFTSEHSAAVDKRQDLGSF